MARDGEVARSRVKYAAVSSTAHHRRGMHYLAVRQNGPWWLVDCGASYEKIDKPKYPW